MHCWFVIVEHGTPERWEVWQHADVGGTSFGHVHCNLKAPADGVGGGPSRVMATWRGADAEALVRVLREPRRYPHRARYRLWPGPNSNSYVTWILREAGLRARLGWRAHGARFRHSRAADSGPSKPR